MTAFVGAKRALLSSVGPNPNVDPLFDNVVLLCNFDGTDGSTTFTDASGSGHTLTGAGNAQLDTAVKKFGSASLLLDGTGDWVTVPDSDDWYFPGEFCVEIWCRPQGTTAVLGLFAQWTNFAGDSTWRMAWFYGDATNKRFLAQFAEDGDPASPYEFQPANTDIDQGVFHHVVLERDSNDKMRLYVDGVMVDSEASVVGGHNAAAGLFIGAYQEFFGSGLSPFEGWIDSIRITKGASRYGTDASFTPPTTAFPTTGP